MIKAIKKRIYGPVIQAWCKFYFKKPRKYSYAGIKGVVLPGVFFPHFTVSTSILIDYISKLELENLEFLELGCGTGLVSVAAAKKGAKVLATDVNKKALENAQLNADANDVEISTSFSDLFNKIPSKAFNYIFINPPYYPKNPKDDKERAWFCGEGFEYFKDLFSQLGGFIYPHTNVIMILSEDCDMGEIVELAKQRQIAFEELDSIKRKGEINIMFKLSIC